MLKDVEMEAGQKIHLTRKPESLDPISETMSPSSGQWLIELTSAILSLSKQPGDDTTIALLRQACLLTNSDKALVFRLSADGKFFNRTHEWMPLSHEDRSKSIDQVPSATVQWILDQLQKQNVVQIDSLSDLDEDAFALKAILETRGSKALICTRIGTKERISGVVGFVRTGAPRAWTSTDRAITETVGLALSHQSEVSPKNRKSKDTATAGCDLALEQSPDPYAFFDRDGSLVWINETGNRFFGSQDMTRSAKSYNILLDPVLHRLGFDETVEEVFHEGKTARFSLETPTERGSSLLLDRGPADILEITLFAVRDASSQVSGVVAGFRDVTGTEEQLAHLRAGEERLRLAFNHSLGILLMSDPDGNIVMANPSCLSFFGLCPSNIKEFVRRIHPDDRKIVESVLTLDDQQTVAADSLTWRCENANGDYVPFEAAVTSITAQKKQYLLIQCRDITSRKVIEEELRATNEKLARDEQVLDEKNSALKEILRQIGDEKEQIKTQIQSNVDRLIVPVLQTLYERADETNKSYLRFMESCLNDITSPFINRLEKLYSKLSPREVEICKMIKSGFSSKDIAKTLHISLLTVHKFRQQIRTKLGVNNQQVNLVNHLNSLHD